MFVFADVDVLAGQSFAGYDAPNDSADGYGFRVAHIRPAVSSRSYDRARSSTTCFAHEPPRREYLNTHTHTHMSMYIYKFLPASLWCPIIKVLPLFTVQKRMMLDGYNNVRLLCETFVKAREDSSSSILRSEIITLMVRSFSGPELFPTKAYFSLGNNC